MVWAGREANQEDAIERRYASLKIEEIILPRGMNRQRDADVLLMSSIVRHGLLQPVIVRRISGERRCILISGMRRLMACRAAGFETVDARILDCDEAEAAACCMEEQMTQRQPDALCGTELLARVPEARVLERFALPKALLDVRYRLMQLPKAVRQEIVRRRLTVDQAEPLIAIGDEYRQMEAAGIIAERSLSALQARRLVCGPQQSARRGRRRSVSLAMDVVGRAVQSLIAKGIPIQMSVGTQEDGVCIRIIVKNELVKSVQEGDLQ